VDGSIFWLVHEKLTRLVDSCMGYIYPMLTPNNYTSDMKVVDPAESKATGYTAFDWRRLPCTKNMASGLAEAHKMLRNRGNQNGIILFFSGGLINKGDFFDGTENFKSEVPVHTFTLGGDAYNQVRVMSELILSKLLFIDLLLSQSLCRVCDARVSKPLRIIPGVGCSTPFLFQIDPSSQCASQKYLIASSWAPRRTEFTNSIHEFLMFSTHTWTPF